MLSPFGSAFIKYVFAPMGDLANELGTNKVTNMVALGVLSSVAEVVDREFLAQGFQKVMGEKKKDLLPLNKEALELGYKAV